jgi:hypothetical protein
MFLGGGGDILDEFRRMERAMTRGAMDPRRTGGAAALASRSAGTNNNNSNSSEVRYSSSSYTYSYRSGGSDAGGDANHPRAALRVHRPVARRARRAPSGHRD